MRPTRSTLAARSRLTRLVALLVVLTLPAGLAWADYPQSAPNDPEYAPAEGSPSNCLTHSVNDDEHYLFGFMPQCAPGAHDPENASGMSADLAWKQYSPGRGDVIIAYIEGGINWHASDAGDLANKVYLNPNALPPPTTPQIGAKVCPPNTLCAADYSDTPDYNHNGFVDPEDIIKRFSTGKLDTHTGYVDDISGWDFYDNQNDPATVDSTYGHANGQMRRAGAQTNNAFLGAGVCPNCMIMPVKAGAEALDSDTALAQAWNFAADHGASVIVSVSANLGYTSFMRQTVKDLWRRGVVVVQASNDFDSLDHQGGMFWPHVLPGNGLVSNSQNSASSSPAENAQTTTYRERSNYSSWGTHNMFSVATDGGTTSEDTPTVGGVMGLVLSYGRDAASQGKISKPLTGPEAVQVVRATASPIDDPTLAWPGKPGWNMQYGYGRPNVLKADQAIAASRIPPVAWIDSPEWYTQYNPTTASRIDVSGHLEATRSNGYEWKLQYGLGPEPSEQEFVTVASGSGNQPYDGSLGSVDLSKIPPSFWKAAFSLSKTKSLETNDQYTVTLRVQIVDASGQMGEERRAVSVVHDPTLLPGFPKHIGPGGESQPALGDLQGNGREAIVFGDSDGVIHAIDPVTGRELPGWPQKTDPTQVTLAHQGIDPGHEPVVANVALGDLNHDGNQWVVATTTSGKVYVFDAAGNRRAGWPKVLNTGVSPPAIPRPAMPFTRLPHQGAIAPPVLYNLEGKGQLDVIQAAWDGHVYAWRPDGTPVPGWPVLVQLPPGTQPQIAGDSIVQDHKLDTAPAIAYLEGPGKPDVVVRSQYTEVAGAGLQPGGISHVFAYRADGTPVPGWPISNNSTVVYYGSAQEFLTEGVNAPIAGDVDGSGKDEVAAQAGIFTPPLLYHGDGSLATAYGPGPNALQAALAGGGAPNAATPDAPVGFTTSGAFGRFGPNQQLVYAQPMVGATSVASALLNPGNGAPIKNYMAAYDAAGGSPVAGFPSAAQGLDFLGAPIVADVSGDGNPDLIQGGDSSALHAYDSSGAQVAGFPKFMSGWILWAPSVGDLLGNGHNDVVTITREGYLYAWQTPGKGTANQEWWSYRHDEHNTGRYGEDTRPPGAARNAALAPGGSSVSFLAPGDNWYDGTAAQYRLTTYPLRATSGSRATRCRSAGPRKHALRHRRARSCGAQHRRRRRRHGQTLGRSPGPRYGPGTTMTAKPSGPAGTHEQIALPAGTAKVVIQAVDGAGNLSVPVTVTAAGASTPAQRAIGRCRVRGRGRRARQRARACRRASRRPTA
ncbi:MAG TPA: hypothetical protein VGY97_13205 [Solirubrobacteraceae bacterium]|nr:hypothetical protein [Solirubrobacteraceae bacterium]